MAGLFLSPEDLAEIIVWSKANPRPSIEDDYIPY